MVGRELELGFPYDEIGVHGRCPDDGGWIRERGKKGKGRKIKGQTVEFALLPQCLRYWLLLNSRRMRLASRKKRRELQSSSSGVLGIYRLLHFLFFGLFIYTYLNVTYLSDEVATWFNHK